MWIMNVKLFCMFFKWQQIYREILKSDKDKGKEEVAK